MYVALNIVVDYRVFAVMKRLFSYMLLNLLLNLVSSNYFQYSTTPPWLVSNTNPIYPSIGIHQAPRWAWECVRGRGVCLRREALPHETTVQTLAQCSVWCGPLGGLWPRPTGKVVLTDTFLNINPNQAALIVSEVSPNVQQFITEIFENFKQNLRHVCNSICSGQYNNQFTVKIRIYSEDLYLKWGTNEDYSLNITSWDQSIMVDIEATTVFGVRHGLETLSQLTAAGEDGSLGILKSAHISADIPVYTHRGLLIDTARHFIPLDIMRRQVEAMAASKMNVLHWHIVDSHSFPLETPRVPKMYENGAYGPRQIYKQIEVRDFIEFSRKRGVRVIMELDAPSHSAFGWQWGPEMGLGNLTLCLNQQPWRWFCIEPPCGQLNPSNQKVYDVLGNIYADILDVLPPQENIHMGGSDIHIGCWNSSEEIIRHQHGLGRGLAIQDFMDLWAEFQNNALQTLEKRRNTSDVLNILWNSELANPNVIQKYINNRRYVLETLYPSNSPIPDILLNMGYRMIFATMDAWILSHGFSGNTNYYNWRIVYANRLPRHNGVLGGEVCLWGESVDITAVDVHIWPRAAAAAERLWSDPEESAPAAELRFLRHRERLLQRGIASAPITSTWCAQNEGACM